MGSGAAAKTLATTLLVLPACLEPSSVQSEIPPEARTVVSLADVGDRTLIAVAAVDAEQPLALAPDETASLFYLAETLEALQLAEGALQPRPPSLCQRARPWPPHLAAFVLSEGRITPTSDSLLRGTSMPDFDFKACFSAGGCVATSGVTLLCNPACTPSAPSPPEPPVAPELPRGCASLDACVAAHAPCDPGLARFGSSDDCAPVEPCGAGPFRPGARGVFVAEGQGPGNGTIEAPFDDLESAIATGTTSIVLGSGEWHARWPDRDLRIVGLCAGATTLVMEPTAGTGAWRVNARTLALSHLTASPGAATVGPTIIARESTIRLESVEISGAPGGAVAIRNQSRADIRRALFSSSTRGALLTVTQTSTARIDDVSFVSRAGLALAVDSASVSATRAHFQHAGVGSSSVAIAVFGGATLSLSSARIIGHPKGALVVGQRRSNATVRATLTDVVIVGPGPHPVSKSAVTLASGELLGLRLAIAEPSLRAFLVYGAGQLAITDLHTRGSSNNPDEASPNAEGAVLAVVDGPLEPHLNIVRWVSVDYRGLSIYGPGKLQGSDWRLSADPRYTANVGYLIESSQVTLARVAIEDWPGLALDLAGATTGEIDDLDITDNDGRINIEESYRPSLDLQIRRLRLRDTTSSLDFTSGRVTLEDLTLERATGLHLDPIGPAPLTLRVNRFAISGLAPLVPPEVPAPDAHFKDGRITVDDLEAVQCFGDATSTLMGVRFDRP